LGYQNFRLAIYCTVGDLNSFSDPNRLESPFRFIEKHLHPNKVYLETFRDFQTIEREKMLQFKAFFREKGIQTSGGITTSAWSDNGFGSLCYTREADREKLKEVVMETASLFDEIMLDDFYFTNCKCPSCIKAKGSRSWAEFRTDLMKKISEEYVIQPAKQVNPRVNMIIKYPNWYEHYQETGYNLKDEPEQFDMIYTGTETRDPQHTHQHLPRYLSYFLMRYLENVKPGKNAGGWFDPYQCGYNPASYADHGYLTLFGKAREVTLFRLGSLLHRDFSLFVPIAGYVLDTADQFLDQLGNPVGTAAYIPYHSSGEDFLHNYIGMLGIPFEPAPYFPEAKDVFLSQNAAYDKDIVKKIQEKLLSGGNVMITSGLLEKLQDNGFSDLSTIRVTGKKMLAQCYGLSEDGVIIEKTVTSHQPVMLPQLDFCTNDVWQLVCAHGNENNCPVLIKTTYGKGSLTVLTIPDDYGSLYLYPREVLNSIRKVLSPNAPLFLDAPAKIGLFTYDNDTFIVKSFLQHQEDVVVTIPKANTRIRDLVSGEEISGVLIGNQTSFKLNLAPMSYGVFGISTS
jgi:hypothetical protein